MTKAQFNNAVETVLAGINENTYVLTTHEIDRGCCIFHVGLKPDKNVDTKYHGVNVTKEYRQKLMNLIFVGMGAAGFVVGEEQISWNNSHNSCWFVIPECFLGENNQ